MLIKSGTREDAVRALINTWLKIPKKYCATCDKSDMGDIATCVMENQRKCLIGDNKYILRVFLKNDIPLMRQTRGNKYASNHDKTIRYAVSLPSDLYLFLDSSMRRLYNERLFSEKHDQNWFAKKFPMFSVPEEI